ncbi:DUF5960 family protein [Ruoffia sp. FAM 26254]|uniref:DUF5960 family protein n=1 Tax=Ruoffia sp. FAM 26254 TaxID=3259518 RepID=UPI0038897CF7
MMLDLKKLHPSSVQFDYFSEKFSRFEADYYRYSNMNIPLSFLTDDILFAMSESQVNYFYLPSFKAKDNRDHFYIFKVRMQPDNHQVRTYEYIRHVFALK